MHYGCVNKRVIRARIKPPDVQSIVEPLYAGSVENKNKIVDNKKWKYFLGVCSLLILDSTSHYKCLKTLHWSWFYRPNFPLLWQVQTISPRWESEESSIFKYVISHKILLYGWFRVTWDQAQFERFPYILSDGYRKKLGLSFRFAMPAGMLFTKRNENRAWSQVSSASMGQDEESPAVFWLATRLR